MMDKLDGSFSGLWTCELCSKTGTDCTCEHFDRGFAWGKDKTFSDAEFAAEVWHADSLFHESFYDAEFYGTSEHRNKFLKTREQKATIDRMATYPDYDK